MSLGHTPSVLLDTINKVSKDDVRFNNDAVDLWQKWRVEKPVFW